LEKLRVAAVRRVEPTSTLWRARPLCLSCSACCRETEMVLTPSDIRRLEALGYRREEFAELRGGFYRLRNVRGRCYFLRGSRCAVYEYRPIGCSMYPIVINVETGGVELDEDCPIAGETTEEELELARELAKRVLRELGIPPRG
jgi:Fe-S-cluster containining protein